MITIIFKITYAFSKTFNFIFFLNTLLSNVPNGEYSNFAFSAVLGLRPKSSPVKYAYLSKLLEDNANILAAFLSKSYCALFYLIFLFKILI